MACGVGEEVLEVLVFEGEGVSGDACGKFSKLISKQKKCSSRTHTMAETGLFGEETTLFDTFTTFRNRPAELLFQIWEVFPDADEAVDHTWRTVADLHQAILLWRDATGPVASLVLVC